ncbi:MAG: hypothetical protein P8Z31_00110 [Gammaproteobacteria bacterium]|jgi:hypothetical protein
MNLLRALHLYRDSRLQLILVQSVSLHDDRMERGALLIGKIEPVAVVIRSDAGVHALGMEGKPVRLSELRENTPELDEMLEE